MEKHIAKFILDVLDTFSRFPWWASFVFTTCIVICDLTLLVYYDNAVSAEYWRLIALVNFTLYTIKQIETDSLASSLRRVVIATQIQGTDNDDSRNQ